MLCRRGEEERYTERERSKLISMTRCSGIAATTELNSNSVTATIRLQTATYRMFHICRCSDVIITSIPLHLTVQFKHVRLCAYCNVITSRGNGSSELLFEGGLNVADAQSQL